MSDLDVSLTRSAATSTSNSHATVYAVFTVSIFFSAGLLFMVQPMFGKLTLPLLGGTPSVWNTAMVFFQAMLLAGYTYAHLISKLQSLRAQKITHLSVMLLAMVVLPISIGEAWRSPPESAPTLWLLGLLAMNVGPPFFALSANAPLIQKWFSRTQHPQANDPYFLYAASNLGSFVGLLGYPILIEPSLTLGNQASLWFGGYAALVALLAFGCAKSQATVRPAEKAKSTRHAAQITNQERAKWLWLSALPSGLLISVTNHITTDIVAIPLLWVVPLGLYLLTFSIAFSEKPILSHNVAIALQPLALVLALTTLNIISGISIVLLGSIAVAAFFLTALVAHGELSKRRPDAAHLTQFYIFMSLGGVVGGSLIALGAPLAFNSILEYPILLIFAALVRPWRLSINWADILLPTALGGAILATELLVDITSLDAPLGVILFVSLVTCVVKAHNLVLRLFLLLSVAGGFSYALGRGAETTTVMSQARTFFGVHTVKRSAQDGAVTLYHGNTLHGMQFSDPEKAGEPLLYYDREAGLGRAIAAANGVAAIKNVGVIGLGSGATACYAEPGQSWTYFEIDPHVAEIAKNPEYFSYVSNCTPNSRISVGDGRLTLAQETANYFDVLVVDAFTSDAIPLHLLTREAVALYDSKLSDEGLLLIHISNRYLDLEPAIANLAKDAGFQARIFDFVPPEYPMPRHRVSSQWVALTRNVDLMATLAPQIDKADRNTHSVWRPLEHRSDIPLWTDDFSNIFDLME